ncbi:hypothetical protein QJS04_geneDACA012340 [Acorus gramineus]|uniref:Ubiquitin-like domain-containing protein n=1 Tax=Acorus gramineus TaxID=55184 RepID=A0AAV9B9Q7_ACOGR|nr:hypothetical protein QJS04_geneDACA012340 [Acorus gramineus]
MYDMQLIVHDGKLIHDEEAHPSRYCVGQGSLIYLYKKVQVHKNVLLNFEYRGSTYPMTVESQHLIRRLKDRIDTQIGLPPHRQELMYMGALMRDGDLVCDYVIGEAPTEDIKIIELPRDELRTFEIEVHNMDTGECEMMTVDPMDTVNTVCAEMRRRGLHGGKDFCIAYKNQMCSWGTLESNGIRETGIILQMRCSSIF